MIYENLNTRLWKYRTTDNPRPHDFLMDFGPPTLDRTQSVRRSWWDKTESITPNKETLSGKDGKTIYQLGGIGWFTKTWTLDHGNTEQQTNPRNPGISARHWINNTGRNSESDGDGTNNYPWTPRDGETIIHVLISTIKRQSCHPHQYDRLNCTPLWNGT